LSSPLSMSVKRLGQILKNGAEVQVGESESRLQSASDDYWPLIRNLLVTEFKFDRSYETARELFGKEKVRFAAVDGSEDQKLLGGLAVFWAGSYAATGSITFDKDQQPTVDYDTGFVERWQGLASCVPIYVDSLPEVDLQSAHRGSQEFTISGPMTEQSTVDNSTIADWIMLFSEIYLAYQLAKSGEYGIIFLDRSLSGTLSNLIHDTAKHALWTRQCAIFGYKIDNVPIDVAELGYGRYHSPHLDGSLPPRGDYLRYSTIFMMQKHKKPLTLDEIARELDYSAGDQITRLNRFMDKFTEQGYLLKSSGKYVANSRYADTPGRLRKLVELFGARLFDSSTGNPLRISDGPEPRWMTTLDIAFLCLFAFNLLIELSQANRILLIGITKDTTARDLISHLVPVAVNEGVWKEKAERVATTDRMLLQAISMFHHTDVAVPWATVEYDTAFQTIVPDFKQRAGYVSGAVSNRIILEQCFVKSYIQLDKSKSDDQFRSNVLFIDRLYHDAEKAPVLRLKHEYASTLEEVQPILWNSNLSANRVQELTMITLKAMTQQSLPEVFGHNKPLYIADKIVKAQRDRAAEIVKATGHWLVTHPKLRKFSFYMNTFRARRSEVESARSRA
jgi:hypothetical protein